MNVTKDDLEELRVSIDNIDGAIMALLAERFRITHRVGLLKRDQGLPPKDEAREAAQLSRIGKQATDSGLDPAFVQALWRQIIDEVLRQHKVLQMKGSDS